ncbi:MAG: hypothetical protein LM601_07830 [Candidatus Verstraetearchaeota archaeon]|jgi:ribosomal protein S27E|nr:hypothetical protein [Candidatus Verstraetearchaeota archaeon]
MGDNMSGPNIGDKCNVCGEGIMCPTGKKWWIEEPVLEENKKVYKLTQKFMEIECDKCGHRHFILELHEFLRVKDAADAIKPY